MHIIDEFLKKIIKDRSVVEVGRAAYNSDSILGVVFHNSEDFIGLHKIDEQGEYDGLTVILKNDISFVGIGGNQRSSFEKIIDNTNMDFEIAIDFTSLSSIIQSISATCGHVALFEEDYSEEFYLGELIKVDEEYLLLNEYGTRKSLDRSTILLRLNLISRIEANGKYIKGILRTFLAS